MEKPATVQEKLNQSITEHIDIATSCFNQSAFEEQVKRMLREYRGNEVQLVLFSMSDVQPVPEDHGRGVAGSILRALS